MVITFAPNTNFKRNIRRQYKGYDFCDDNYYIYFNYFDWGKKEHRTERYRLNNKDVYLKYKNKILEQVYK